MEQKKTYTPPVLTTVEFRTERGFATSLGVMDNLVNLQAQFDEVTLWGDPDGYQKVTGFNMGEDDEGLAAGYFYNGDPSSWF